MFDRNLAWSLYPELTLYLQEREDALGSNTVSQTWDINDIDHMESLVEGLNLADPGLKLDYYQYLWQMASEGAIRELHARTPMWRRAGRSPRSTSTPRRAPCSSSTSRC